MLAAVVLVLALPVSYTGAASAQGPDTPVSSEAGAAPAATTPTTLSAPAQPGAEASPFAAPVQPPRTLRAYWHVFIAFAVTWVLLFGYALSLGRRWARLEREIHTLAGKG